LLGKKTSLFVLSTKKGLKAIFKKLLTFLLQQDPRSGMKVIRIREENISDSQKLIRKQVNGLVTTQKVTVEF
jgi:hypothetical protein